MSTGLRWLQGLLRDLRDVIGLVIVIGGLVTSALWQSYRVGVYTTETTTRLEVLSSQLAALQATATGAAATLQAHELRLERHDGKFERLDGRVGVLESWRDRHETARPRDTSIREAGG